ncbi:outer membrane protein [Rhizobium ruizarguesonis]
MKFNVGTIFAFFAMVGIANATDVIPSIDLNVAPPPTPFETPTTDWGGFYVGLSGGGSLLKGDFEFCGCGPDEKTFGGARVGAFAGYNFLLTDGVIAGVEADVAYDWNSEGFAGADEIGSSGSASIRARLGEVRGPALIYLAGGWTATNVFIEDPDDESNVNGWTIGAGIDWAATEKTFVRAEYRYNNFADVDLAGVNTRFDQNILSVGLGIRF